MPSEKQLAAVKRLTKRIDNLRTANAELLEVCECALSSIKQKLMFGSGEDVRTERDMISALLEQAIRKHKGK